ncbi:putative neurolysin [Helianthus annuus]|uniref:Neurolysin n=1 Tax=Helianthus annuus TaxID=4232 RepID=A0A251T2G3_HELAN|nr:probable thimet oligopeptidase isoform X1 [Helianthus annuus]KAF5778218.1 putative neurolysin [Helianthus annuus]KAJ0489649.1 putative neurolysin [Helianthus annuus]KAJ0505561.1 putative neurolysin [Helianthus annuus]KAJ0675230.1 putative neurolysin [Helianthus annuus]KAJ0678539.1 putative neurolysin [Helianthus annuus]
MSTHKRGKRNVLAITGAAAFLTIAVKFAIDAINSKRNDLKKKGLRGSNVRVNLSAFDILKLADRVIANSKAVYNAVASVPLDKVTYANVIKPLEELEAYQFPLVQSCIFPKFVSTSEEVRKASAEAERRIDAHVSACSRREDVYLVVKAFAAKGEWTNAESKRYAQSMVRDFERNGMNLTLTKREELQRLRAQIDELSRRYIQNLNDDNSFLLFDQSELLGLPLEFLKSLDRSENNKYKIILRSHHVSALLDLCKVGPTRRVVAGAYGRRCEANLPILEKLVQLRHKSARLLGYTNYADFVTDRRMAMSSSKVFEFLEEISASLNDLATRELTLLKDMKKKEEGEIPFGIEDLPYYVKKVEEEQFDLDFEAVKQYFPVSLVQSGIFKVCQDLFGLRFEKVSDAEVWHPDVELYSVFDLNSTDLIGHFYLDMYTREGKYGHTCVVPLQNGSLTNDSRQIPVALLVAQIKKEVGDDPVLLRFSEVLKLFHEFGHVVHYMCNRASYAKFSGLRLDSDFVEIPAQVLENWCYEAASMKLISGFHQDITKPIGDDVCKSLKRWRCSFSALKLKQEILYCLFDQIIHSTENVDIVGLFKHLHPKVMLGLPMLEGTNPASSFPSSAIGCEAACYSHIWSQVFAADIYASKFRDNIFNQHTGMQFRNKVLAPGGSKEPIELLSDFLGREPSIQAFVDSKSQTFDNSSFR